MAGEKKTVTEAVPPVVVTVVDAGEGLVAGAKAQTPPDQPNIVLNVVQPIVALAVRFVHVYLGNLVGLLAAGMTSDIIPAKDFSHLVLECAGLAVAGAVVLLLKDIVTLTARLEQRFPLLTGSV